MTKDGSRHLFLATPVRQQESHDHFDGNETHWKEFQVHNRTEDVAVTSQTAVEADGSANDDDDDENFMHEVVHSLFATTHGEQGEDVGYETQQYLISPDTRTMIVVGPEESPALGNSKNQDVNKTSVPSPANTTVTKISIRHWSESSNSTGLGVWSGAELLSRFLVENASLVRGKHVLELGAGTGLCSLVAHSALGAQHVTATDGDSAVLKNLRYNIRQNTPHRGTTKHIMAPTDENSNDRKDYDGCSHIGGLLECRQLIWGRKMAQKFIESCNNRSCYTHDEKDASKSGRIQESIKNDCDNKSLEIQSNHIQVVLATDCIYMSQSLMPFWETVDTLLSPDCVDRKVKDGSTRDDEHEMDTNDSNRDDNCRLLLYVNVCASQVPIKRVSEVAFDFGFIGEEVQPQIFVFRRRQRPGG